MLTAFRRGALATIVAVAVVAGSTPAWADGSIDPVDCTQDPVAPECTVHVDDPGHPGDPGGGSGNGGGSGSDNCWLKRLDDPNAPPGGPLPGSWYVRVCSLPGGGQSESQAFWVTGGPDPAVLAQEAVSRLELPAPVIQLNPAPPADQVLYIPTWLWLRSDSVGAQSAIAFVPGLLVKATARPVRVAFATGDGNSVTCGDTGTAWKSGMDPMAPSPTCGYTYPKPGSYILTVTVTWSVTWAGGGATGTVDPLTTTASQPVRVVEAGALNTNGG